MFKFQSWKLSGFVEFQAQSYSAKQVQESVGNL